MNTIQYGCSSECLAVMNASNASELDHRVQNIIFGVEKLFQKAFPEDLFLRRSRPLYDSTTGQLRLRQPRLLSIV